MTEPLAKVLERVERFRSDPPGADAYRDSGDAQSDAERLADVVVRYRAALERIEREDHHAGPGWFAEIAAQALMPDHLDFEQLADEAKHDPRIRARVREVLDGLEREGKIVRDGDHYRLA